jgi:hypothetical protein
MASSVLRTAYWIALDLLSAPLGVLRVVGGRSWGNRVNALGHIHFLCHLCPKERQALRDPLGRGICVWNRRWNEGRYDIPPNFGVRNWLSQYRGVTDLRAYKDLA